MTQDTSGAALRTMPAEEDHEIVIVGGGPVGTALAIALADTGRDVLILEARPRGEAQADARTLAMAHGSRLILERLQAWSRIDTPTPIRTIHVSQKGGFGRALLHADDAGLPALGYVVDYAGLHRALSEALAGSAARITAGAAVEDVQCQERITVHYRYGGEARRTTASLLVLADGGKSLGERAGAKLQVRDYHQEAVVGLVTASQPHANVAFERFTPDGPVALLPFRDRYALVWTVASGEATEVTQLADDEFLRRLQTHFGNRAGHFLSVSARACFPLSLRYAAEPVLPRTVLLGNAAQALHPIAGQGFNLGLRDAWELADVVMHHGESDPGARTLLDRYRALRKKDRFGGIAITDSLVRIFSNDSPPLRLARGGGLALLDLSPTLKRALMHQMIFGASA